MGCPVTSWREQKKERTRAAIADAALRLASARGPDAVTVEEISAAAGVSPRTFFNYFPSKEDAVLGVDLVEKQELARALAARPAEEAPLDALRAVCLTSACEKGEDLVLLARRVKLVGEDEGLQRRFLWYFSELERVLTQVVAERCGVDPDVDPYPAVVVSTVANAFRVTLRRWAEAGGGEPFEQRLEDTFATLAAGLAPPPHVRPAASAAPAPTTT